MSWPILGYSAFGFLLGFTTGLTDGEVAKYFLGLLVAFLGGSIGYFIQKDGDKKILGAVLFFFSFFCVVGLPTGIVVKTNQLLSLGHDEGGKKIVTKDIYLKSFSVKGRMENIRSLLHKISIDETVDIKSDVRKIQKLVQEIEEGKT